MTIQLNQLNIVSTMISHLYQLSSRNAQAPAVTLICTTLYILYLLYYWAQELMSATCLQSAYAACLVSEHYFHSIIYWDKYRHCENVSKYCDIICESYHAVLFRIIVIWCHKSQKWMTVHGTSWGMTNMHSEHTITPSDSSDPDWCWML